MEILVYPVSAVIKCWHWLLAGILGVPESGAWIAAIILLVFTVRGIIAPFSWQTYKVGRASYLMRPHIKAIQQRYGTSTEVEDIRAEREAIKAIRKEHGYGPLAGCVPALIQLPVFLGLYRLLYWLAVPGVGDTHTIGILSSEDIASFRAATLFDAPLPAYVAMSTEQFASLGTTAEDVRRVGLPLLIAAIIFTSCNLLISQLRNRTTLEWETALARRSYYALYWLIPFIALSLITAGLTGLVPIALLLYWVCNNLWTSTQTLALWALLVRKYPSEELHREHVRTAREAAVEKKKALKRLPRAERRTAKQAEKQERKAAKALEKQRDAALRSAKSNNPPGESPASPSPKNEQ